MRLIPVAWLTAVTLASGTTAPCGSTTVPTIVAVDALCAFARTTGRQQHRRAMKKSTCKRFIEGSPSLQMGCGIHLRLAASGFDASLTRPLKSEPTDGQDSKLFY